MEHIDASLLSVLFDLYAGRMSRILCIEGMTAKPKEGILCKSCIVVFIDRHDDAADIVLPRFKGIFCLHLSKRSVFHGVPAGFFCCPNADLYSHRTVDVVLLTIDIQAAAKLVCSLGCRIGGLCPVCIVAGKKDSVSIFCKTAHVYVLLADDIGGFFCVLLIHNLHEGSFRADFSVIVQGTYCQCIVMIPWKL